MFWILPSNWLSLEVEKLALSSFYKYKQNIIKALKLHLSSQYEKDLFLETVFSPLSPFHQYSLTTKIIPEQNLLTFFTYSTALFINTQRILSIQHIRTPHWEIYERESTQYENSRRKKDFQAKCGRTQKWKVAYPLLMISKRQKKRNKVESKR